MMIIDDLKKREPFFLEPARKKVNGRRTWVCPKCGNGKGKDGDGISLDPNSRNSPHYKCFRCGFYGDVIDLFKYHKGFSDNSEAFKAFSEYFGYREFGKNSRYDGFNSRRKTSEMLEYHKAFQKRLNTPQETVLWEMAGEEEHLSKDFSSSEILTEFFETAKENLCKTNYTRGISLETLQRFKVGFVEQWKHPKAPNSQPSPRLIVPTSKSSYLARSTVDNSKIKVGNVHIFNIDAIRTAQQPIFIVEGEIDALSIIDVGGEAIALGGISNIGLLVQQYQQQAAARKDFAALADPSDNKEQGSIPAGRADIGSSVTLVLALDNDRAGEEATEKLAEELRSRNIPFYRADGLYGDFKDANEVLMHSR